MSSSEWLPPGAPDAELTAPGGNATAPVAEPAAAGASAAADVVPALSAERIAEQVAALDAVGELPLAKHVEVYQRLHAQLQSALAEIDNP